MKLLDIKQIVDRAIIEHGGDLEVVYSALSFNKAGHFYKITSCSIVQESISLYGDSSMTKKVFVIE